MAVSGAIPFWAPFALIGFTLLAMALLGKGAVIRWILKGSPPKSLVNGLTLVSTTGIMLSTFALIGLIGDLLGVNTAILFILGGIASVVLGQVVDRPLAKEWERRMITTLR